MSDPTALHRFARALARRRGYAEHADDFAQWLALASLTRAVRRLDWELVDYLRETHGDLRSDCNRVTLTDLADAPGLASRIITPVVFIEDLSILMTRAGLTARESEMLRRRFFSGEDLTEIGASHGITGAGVGMTLLRALRKLKRTL